MNWSETFADDLLNLTESQLFEKYDGKIPQGIKIQDVLTAIKQLSAEQRLVQKTWGTTSKDNTFNLLKIDTGYEVFQIERGGKQWISKHLSLDAALFDKIDRIFNAMLYEAEDSDINSKRS